VTLQPEIRGGIIAAGDGRRLREAGWTLPKPLVPVNGVPLIEAVIRNFIAAGFDTIAIILNEQELDCAEWVRRRFPDTAIEFIVKTTRSSLESLREVTARLGAGRALVSTVDAWCRPEDFARFVSAAASRPATASVLAVTPFVDDEKPLWVRLGAGGRVREIGGTGGDVVTAGIYLLSERARGLAATVDLPRLRDYLGWLVERGEVVYGEVIETVVDVDRPADITVAEEFAARRSVTR
jgi:NDP-sugar pyrophosphorylase family protein